MGMGREEKLVRDLLAEHGTFLRHTRHGDLWGLPSEETFQCLPEVRRAGSPDWRAWKNSLKELQRKLRALGLLEDDPQQDDEDGPEPAEEDSMTNLEKLGIHVQRTSKTVVIHTDTTEAVVTGRALARLLGLVEEDEDTPVEIVDVNGKRLFTEDECVTFKVNKETIEEHGGDFVPQETAA